MGKPSEISIHALRVEGDVVYIFNTVYKRKISIHALRVEGDLTLCFQRV